MRVREWAGVVIDGVSAPRSDASRFALVASSAFLRESDLGSVAANESARLRSGVVGLGVDGG